MVNVTVDFGGVHVFVAGGTSGINLGIAEGFALAGARVAVMSRSPERMEAGRSAEPAKPWANWPTTAEAPGP